MVANSPYHLTSSWVGPLMISGVRASSMRMESTSSTIAKLCAALDALLDGAGHVVAEVVEAELVVGAVGDVARVGDPPLVGPHLGKDHADGEPEEVVHAAHPLGLELGQVVVDGDDVDALALEGVEVGGQGGDQGLALTGLHLGDVAEVQCRATHDLDVEVALAEHPAGGLAHGGERLGHEVVEALALGQPLPELVRHALELRVTHRDEVVLDGVDGLRDAFERAEDLALADAEELVENGRHGAVTPEVGLGGADGARGRCERLVHRNGREVEYRSSAQIDVNGY